MSYLNTITQARDEAGLSYGALVARAAGLDLADAED